MRRRRLLLVAGACAALVALGLLLDRETFLHSWLFAWVTWTGLSLGCVALLLLWHIVGGQWGTVIRKPLEAGTATLPWLAAGFLPVALGLGNVYPWVKEPSPDAGPPKFRDVWLSPGFFVARTVFYFACWSLTAFLLRRASRREDETGSRAVAQRMRDLAGPLLLLLGVTVTFASIDWTMSLEPRWASAAYGAIVVAGQAVAAMAFAILALASLASHRKVAKRLTTGHLHDLGNLLLALVMLWAYLSFGQYLILWSGNQPAETGWVVRRTTGGWEWIAWSLILFHFLAPFLVLLSRDAKTNRAPLTAVAIGVALLHVLEQYWLVVPAWTGGGVRTLWLDPLLFVAIGGVWIAVYALELGASPLLPRTFDVAPRGLAHE